MANLTTTEDLVIDALRKAGEKTDGTSDYETDALEAMNSFYRSILAGGNEFDVELGEAWSWAKSANPGILTLKAPYETGTVSLTNASLVGAFSAAPAISLAGRFLKLENRSEYFRIATHVAASTAFTLDGEYTGETGSGLAYAAHKLDYELASGIIRQIGPMTTYKTQGGRSDNEGKIFSMELAIFSSQFPMHLLQSGVPTHFTVVYATDGLSTVRFNTSAAEDTRVEYDYIPEPTALTREASSIPVIPKAYRQALASATAYSLCMDKEDSKATHFFQLTQQKLKAMVGGARREQRHTSKDRGRIIPRADLMGRGGRWPTQE